VGIVHEFQDLLVLLFPSVGPKKTVKQPNVRYTGAVISNSIISIVNIVDAVTGVVAMQSISTQEPVTNIEFHAINTQRFLQIVDQMPRTFSMKNKSKCSDCSENLLASAISLAAQSRQIQWFISSDLF
jgi:hypothetical protein